MIVSVAEAKNKLTQLIQAVEKGERVTISRHGHPVVDIVPTEVNKRLPPTFGTMRGKVKITPDQLREALRPMTDSEVEAFLEGR